MTLSNNLPADGAMSESSILEEAETQLRVSLQQEFASPFIAHHAVDRPDDVRSAVRQVVNGEFRRVRRVFQQAPAVALWTIADALASNYAGDGDISCYPHIEDALDLEYTMQPAERTELRSLFRSAAMRLGLSLPPVDGGEVTGFTWQPVDDFFAQAGIANNQADRLAKLFRSGQGSFGVPEADSTDSLARWETEVVERHCPQGLRRLPKVLLSDTTGYHAGLFARLEAGGEADTPFARQLRDALGAVPTPTAHFVARLAFVDGQLLVRDGQGAAEFEVNLEGWTEPLRRIRDFALPVPWPSRIWCRSSRGGAQELSVLQNGVAALIFDAATGRLDRTIGTADSIAVVRRGEVAIISRLPFRVGDEESFEAGPDAHVRYAVLDRAVTLEVNGQRISLRPQARASLRALDGRFVARDGAVPLLAGVRSLVVEYPGARDLATSGALELELRHPALPDGRCTVPCQVPDEADQMTVPLAELLPTHGPFGLLQIDLRQVGSDRRLARERFWLWPGLSAFPDGERFVAPTIPPNWDERRSERLHRNAGGELQLASPNEVPYEWARLVMRHPNDMAGVAEPLAVFLLPPPGVSLVLRESDGSRRPLRIGQLLALSTRDASTIQIRTPDYGAALDIRGDVEPQSFQRGMRELSAVRLMSTVGTTGNHDELRYRSSAGAEGWRPLLRFVDVADVLHFEVSETADESTVRLQLGRLPTAVRVRAEEVMRHASEEFRESHPALQVLRFEDTQTIEIVIRKRRLPVRGLYLARIEVAYTPGRWLELTNDRRDRYDWLVANMAPVSPVREAEANELLDAYTQLLGRCAALECWEGSLRDHLVPRWKSVLYVLQRQSPPEFGPLLAAAHANWDTERASTWVPIRHPLEHVANLYGAPPAAYRAIRLEHAAAGSEMIREIARLDGRRTVEEILRAVDIDLRVLGAFANVAALSSGKETVPRDFDFRRYRDVLAVTPPREAGSLWTPRQERLTAEHHAWCCEEFDRRLRRVALPPNNSIRVPMLRRVALAATDLLQPPGVAVVAYGALTAPHSLQREEQADHRALLNGVPSLMSALVRYSLIGRQRDFEMCLVETAEMPVGLVRESLGFATRLAPELLAFYLLLWHVARIGDPAHA
jgi:hypothetical protein